MTAIRMAALQKMHLNGELQLQSKVPKRSLQNILTEKQLDKTIHSLQDLISHAAYQKLLESIPSVITLVQSLSAKLPLSIDHGDLFGGNVIVENGEPLIYDWSNSSITHPFLSIVQLVEEVAEIFFEEISEDVLRAYLCEWRDELHIDQLHDEYTKIRLLAPIYYLVVHVTVIFPAFLDNVDKKEIIDDYTDEWVNNISKIKKHV